MRPFWDGHPEMARDLLLVRETILARAATEDTEVQSAIGLLLETSGKMLRPAFVLLSSQFGTPDHSRMLRIGAAVEMLHMATLVHDDIIDGAALRRGAATLHTLQGARKAVLVGDWLFVSCFALISDLVRLENTQSLARLVARICGSEISQSADRFVVHTSVRRYLRRIAGKTAALFSLSFFVGAQESGCAQELCGRLRRLGYCLGMGFQIIDDILDFRHAGAESGKPTGSDLAQGIYTLPTILGLRGDDGRLARALDRRSRGGRAIARMTRLIEEREGIEGARALARLYTERSLREIRCLPESPARCVLEEVATRLLHRSY
jgi:heptaprenyl diphosphate synthase